MKSKLFIYLSICLPIIANEIIAEVPASKIRKPAVPYLGQSFNFQTIETKIFDPLSIGMFPNRYSDLILNPAFIPLNDTLSFYIDLNADESETLASGSSIPLISSQLYEASSITPRWYGYTIRSTVQTTPLYNFAAMIPLSDKFSLGFFNRSLIDYGPFRSAQSYQDWRKESFAMADAYENIVPKRVEIDENQQTVLGNQTELVLGMKLMPELDLGLSVGHYVFSREGNLYDSKRGVYPHSSFADLNDEALDISGRHYETGLGALYHFNDKMDIGLYGSFIFGSGDENTTVLDTSYNWSEQSINTAYYAMRYAFLNASNQLRIDSKEPKISFVYQWQIKDKWLFRSYFSHGWKRNDLSGSNASLDTTSGDRTYDHWVDTNIYEFRRHQYEGITRSSFSGTGEENVDRLMFFASFIYIPDDNWSLFSGIGFHRTHYTYEVDETARYNAQSVDAYTIYDPTTFRSLYTEKNTYQLESEICEWNCIIPVGMKAKIYKGLFILLGTDLTLTMTDEKADATLFFPEKVTQRWENGAVIEDTQDNERLETFSSNPPKDFTRQVKNRFGLLYHHASGFNVYLKSTGDILTTNNWAFGFELVL
jgi:hypothetical protein